jgi:hypothetical protein
VEWELVVVKEIGYYIAPAFDILPAADMNLKIELLEVN